MASVETRTCRTCSSEFKIEPDDFGFYERMGVPAPALCPVCRFQRRSVWRNERTLYKSVCALCKNGIVTMYHPDSPFTVYCQPCWHSDKWDPASYAKDYDSSRPFFEQFHELMLAVPKLALFVSSAMGPVINTDYANFVGAAKDSYLIFNSGPVENCAYSRGLSNCRDTYDTYFAEGSERVYEGINAEKSSGVAFGQNIADCMDSWFLLDCTGCQNCFGTVNARHGSYMFFNEKIDKDELRSRVSSIMGSYAAIEETKKKFDEHAAKFPRRENSNFKCVDSTGNYLFECKNCKECFEVTGSENLKYSFACKFAKDCYDVTGHGRKAELMLEAVACGLDTRVIGSSSVESSHDIEYSLQLSGSEYCFGCDGLKKGSHSILNKKYEPEEYARIREKIIAELKGMNEYGLFFPPKYAPFAYNEGTGRDHAVMSKEMAVSRGFSWQENIPETRGKETIKAEDIPDNIKDVPDSILNEVLVCVECGRNYKLIKVELDMYRKALLPVPRRCFSCRHEQRIRRRGSQALFDRKCDRCAKDIRTPFAPDRPETVYCEQCYQQEVV